VATALIEKQLLAEWVKGYFILRNGQVLRVALRKGSYLRGPDN